MFWRKALEAAFWTFLEVFVATFAAGFAGIQTGDWKAMSVLGGTAALAGIAACVSLVKSLIVRNMGVEDSPLITGG